MPDVQYMAIVANSFKWHFAAFFMKIAMLFIDEIKQVLEHIAVGTFDNRDRAKVLATIKKPFKTPNCYLCRCRPRPNKSKFSQIMRQTD